MPNVVHTAPQRMDFQNNFAVKGSVSIFLCSNKN